MNTEVTFSCGHTGWVQMMCTSDVYTLKLRESEVQALGL